MAFNITEFISEISQYGVSKTNQYDVMITFPSAMDNLRINGVAPIETARRLHLRAEDVRIPGISIMTSDNNIYGPGPFQKNAFNVAFTEIPIVFLADKSGDIYKFFYAWMNQIFDFAGPGGNTSADNASYGVAYKSNIVSTIIIRVFDSTGKEQIKLTMFDAYPVSMNEIPMSWNQQNELMKVTMSFTFSHWKLDNINYTGL